MKSFQMDENSRQPGNRIEALKQNEDTTTRSICKAQQSKAERGYHDKKHK